MDTLYYCKDRKNTRYLHFLLPVRTPPAFYITADRKEATEFATLTEAVLANIVADTTGIFTAQPIDELPF